MTELILIEIISITSLIFTVLITVLDFTSLNSYFLLFLWTTVVSSIYGVNKRKAYSKYILLAILLPLFLFKTNLVYYFLFSLFILIYLYLIKSLERGSYGNYVDDLKNSSFIFLALLIISYLGDILPRFMAKSIPFIIIYFITTIILIRSLRHLSLGMDKDIIRRSNKRYLATIIGISGLVTLDNLRNIVFGTISLIVGTIYKLIVDIVFGLLYYPISAAIFGLLKFGNWILSLLGKMDGEIDQIDMVNGDQVEGVATLARELPVVDISLKIVVGLLAIYILYRLIKKYGERQRVLMDYIEEREFVGKEQAKRPRNLILRKPKQLKEQIRYYYKLYLLKLTNNNIIIESSYTSFEINEKAKEKYPLNTIEKFRNIYIDNRYGYKLADIESVDEIEKLYKDIEKPRK